MRKYNLPKVPKVHRYRLFRAVELPRDLEVKMSTVPKFPMLLRSRHEGCTESEM